MMDLLKELRDPSISGAAAKVGVLAAADEIQRLRAIEQAARHAVRQHTDVALESLRKALEK